MSHRWSCPTDWEARREGERAFERGDGSWCNPYRDDWGRDRCEEAERAWERGHREAERHAEERRVEERRMDRRRQQAREEEYWAQQAEYARQEEGATYDEAMRAEEEEYYEQMFWHDVLFPTFDGARWADDGGTPT